MRERVPTGRRGRPSKSMIAAALERPFCAYLHKICLNNRLEGHKYCIDHIMNDKTAPYRQCTFVHGITGRRCIRAARKVDRRASPLCQFHRSFRLNAPVEDTYIPLEESQGLLEDLAHHKREPGNLRSESKNTFWLPKGDGSAIPSTKLCRALAQYNNQRQADKLAPVEMPTMEEIAAKHNNADSDTESVDNHLDVFKHASVFTEEELTRTLRDKMIKLRRLYIEQLGHIQYILKEKRLKYIQMQRIEDDTYGDMYSFRNYRDSPDYAKLKAMLSYHKTSGPDSLLQEQAKKRKIQRPPTVGPHRHPDAKIPNSNPEPKENICVFSKTPHGCDGTPLPLSPYCKKHILYDKKQLLFRPCAGGIPPCLSPIVSFVRRNRCWQHYAG